MNIPPKTPRFQGTVIAYVPAKEVELKSVLISDMSGYTRDIHSFEDRVEFRFATKKNQTGGSRLQAFENKIREKLALSRLADWNRAYNVRYGFDSNVPTPPAQPTEPTKAPEKSEKTN